MDEQLKIKKCAFTLVGTCVKTEIVIFAKNKDYQIINNLNLKRYIYFLERLVEVR